MATTPKTKVSFKTHPSMYDDFFSATKPVPVSDNNDLTHLQTYIIIYYTTVGTEDTLNAYDMYLNECHYDHDKYISRYKSIRQFAEEQVKSGERTGYHLYGYVLRPFSLEMLQEKNHHWKFQVKNKTYLNGPLKNNEFLQKKGGMYV